MNKQKRRRWSQHQIMTAQLMLSVLILFTKGGIQEVCITIGEMLFSDIPNTESVELID